MSKGVLPVFETALQKTHQWLNDVMIRMGWDDQHKAYQVLRAVLHAIRDRLPAEIAVKFASQLPMIIRGFYYEGWKPSQTPIKVTTLNDFLALVSMHISSPQFTNNRELEAVTKVVFAVLNDYLSHGEMENIKKAFPEHLSSLWPAEPAYR